MTPKEIYCMGRAEYLAEYEGCSLTEGYAIAEKEKDKSSEHIVRKVDGGWMLMTWEEFEVWKNQK